MQKGISYGSCVSKERCKEILTEEIQDLLPPEKWRKTEIQQRETRKKLVYVRKLRKYSGDPSQFLPELWLPANVGRNTVSDRSEGEQG